MKINMDALAQELGISKITLRQFIEDFELNIADVLDDELNLSDNFVKFAREHKDFLQAYDKDFRAENKTGQDIANRINRPFEKVEEALQKDFPNLYESNGFKTSISSYNVDRKMGGDYSFVYSYFGHSIPIAQHNLIGYRDLFFFVADRIEPFINPLALENWGINRPAGIILYGPPGSGKVHWARKIAKMIDYSFVEVTNETLSVLHNVERATKFKEFLCSERVKMPKTLIFIDHFDEIGQNTNAEGFNERALELRDLIVDTINHNLQDEILFVGSSNSLAVLDKEMMAPGRFDLTIPIFPPNIAERAELILGYMLVYLKEDAPLRRILRENQADKIPFWTRVAQQMFAFSNTMVIDFTQSLKKKIHSEYVRQGGKGSVVISDQLLNIALAEAAAKLTGEYLQQVTNFVNDLAQNNGMDFQHRVISIATELDRYRVKDEPARKIGFNVKDEGPNVKS